MCRSCEKVQEVQELRRQIAAAGRGDCRFTAAEWWIQCAGMCRSCCLIDKVSMKVMNAPAQDEIPGLWIYG